MSKSPSLRRIQADIRELALDPSDRYHAAPLENDMFEWWVHIFAFFCLVSAIKHISSFLSYLRGTIVSIFARRHFTIRGADDTDFAGGVYHGRILLPAEYPFKPPHILFLTPNGRFETNTKVCLSFSAFHPELWQPAWGIRLILEALISFLPTPADGAIGAVDWKPSERKALAKKSVDYCCPLCGKIVDLLPKLKPKDTANGEKKPSRFQQEIEKLQRFQELEHKNKDDGKKETDNASEEPNDTDEKVDEKPKIEQKETETSPPANDKPGLCETETMAPASNSQDQAEQVTDDSDNHSSDRLQRDRETTPQPNFKPEEEEEVAHVEETAADVPLVAAAPSTSSPLLDPILNVAIVVLAMICFLLVQKLQALLDDLEALEAQD